MSTRTVLSRAVVCMAALLGIGPIPAMAASASALVAEGNRLYREGKLDEALVLYKDAARLEPGSAALHYNIGNVLYRKGEFEKAYEEYRQAFPASDPTLSEGARFNAGNSHFARRNWADAIRHYREALRINPGDSDAKKNLELAILALEEQKKKEQEQKQKSPEDQQKDDQPPPPPEGGGQQKHEEQQPEKKESQASPSPESRSQEKLPREEALRLLDALKRQDTAPREPMKVPAPEKRPEKDW